MAAVIALNYVGTTSTNTEEAASKSMASPSFFQTGVQLLKMGGGGIAREPHKGPIWIIRIHRCSWKKEVRDKAKIMEIDCVFFPLWARRIYRDTEAKYEPPQEWEWDGANYHSCFFSELIISPSFQCVFPLVVSAVWVVRHSEWKCGRCSEYSRPFYTFKEPTKNQDEEMFSLRGQTKVFWKEEMDFSLEVLIL